MAHNVFLIYWKHMSYQSKRDIVIIKRKIDIILKIQKHSKIFLLEFNHIMNHLLLVSLIYSNCWCALSLFQVGQL